MDPNLVLLLVYGGTAVAYLLILPILLVIYVDKRFNPSSAWEKLLMFFLCLLFFPGMLLVGGFINHRPRLRKV